MRAAWTFVRFSAVRHAPALIAVAAGALASSVLAIGMESVGGLSAELWINVLAAGLTITALAATYLGWSIRNSQTVAVRLTERSAELSQLTDQLIETNQILESEIRDRLPFEAGKTCS